ncbi:MAG TPA: hypothetical protein VHZ31_02690 [Solirubrobacteraceae bacterium]|jgi:hypothetical protein|nr:hypothetical protein [Solirubrobacteraceae bacterium]
MIPAGPGSLRAAIRTRENAMLEAIGYDGRRPRRRGVRLPAALGLVALLLLGSATAANARPQKIIGMPLRSTLLLASSNVACGSGVTAGHGFVDCGIAGSDGQPKKGSYFVIMTDVGRVNMIAASTRTIVSSHTPAARERPAGRALITQTAHAGDQIVLPSMPQISCRVQTAGGHTTIFCYYVNKKTGVVRANSFSFGMSDTVTTVLGWNAAGKNHLLGDWPENG